MSKVLVIGSGAREHIISECLYKSTKVDKVYVLNNCDIDCNKYINVYIGVDNQAEIVKFCKDKDIGLVIIGSEQPIVDGLSDYLMGNDIKCFAPSRAACRLESSKIFAKEVMINCNIPTSDYEVFSNYNDAVKFMNDVIAMNYVIKYDGLAGGKGVFLPKSFEDACDIFKNIFEGMCFGMNPKILIEKRLVGKEVSVMGFCNGKDVWLMPQAQDYKRRFDGDEGPNTGGMGSICPVNTLGDDELEELRLQMRVIVRAMKYRGVLYAGVMKDIGGGYNILEFNCRFGDPEAQVILSLLDSDLYDIFMGCVNGEELDIKWKSGYVVNVVSSHEDYPLSKSSEPLDMSIGKFEDDCSLYFGSVRNQHGVYYTKGGRVCSVVGYDECGMYGAMCKVYNNIHKVKYNGQFYRRDIGLDYVLSRYNISRRIKIGILGSTKGTSTQLLIDKVNGRKINASIEVIVSNRKKAYILERANKNSFSYIYLPYAGMTREEYDIKLIKLLRAYDIDVLLLVGYMRIVTSTLIDEYRGRIFNIHPSLLPKYAGGMDIDVHRQILDMGDSVSGCTMHHVTEEVDGGQFVMQKQMVVDKLYTPEILKGCIQELEKDMIVQFIQLCVNGQYNLWGGYKRSGVDIDEGNRFVKMIKGLSTGCNDVIGGFCSAVPYKDYYLGFAADGVGTKLELAKQFNMYDTIGIDLVAMSVNDLITRGFKPKYFLDYLAVDKLNADKHFEVMRGIYKGCEIAKCDLIGGETAEMKGVYSVGSFDLAGFAVGDGSNILPNFNNSDKNIIYGVVSNGLHSNGYSLVRRAVRYGGYSINDIMKPTKIYMEVLELLELTPKILGIAHITGGGLMENLSRVVSDKFECKIDWDSWVVPEIFRWVQRTCDVREDEMRRTFNCGIGMAIVTSDVLSEELVDKFKLIRIGHLVDM